MKLISVRQLLYIFSHSLKEEMKLSKGVKCIKMWEKEPGQKSRGCIRGIYSKWIYIYVCMCVCVIFYKINKNCMWD